MKTLIEMEFGSIIYGTNLPTSDKDYKAVFIPSADDILLQRTKGTIIQNTNPTSTKNTSDDIDKEMFSMQQYLKLLMEGQTVALDILFTSEKHYTMTPDKWWYVIQENKKEFLHRGVNSFVGYTKAQAAKYGLKGFRVAALKETLDFLNGFPEQMRLSEVGYNIIHKWISDVNNEHILLTECKGPNGQSTPHLQVNNRKIPLHATVKYSRQLFEKLFDEYGHRARLAETNQGVDFKALMHAVRVANEAKELLTTAHITFPRPEKDLLLQIRKGEMPYKQVAEIIEQGLLEVEEVSKTSILQATPNRELADELVRQAYRETVCQSE